MVMITYGNDTISSILNGIEFSYEESMEIIDKAIIVPELSNLLSPIGLIILFALVELVFFFKVAHSWHRTFLLNDNLNITNAISLKLFIIKSFKVTFLSALYGLGAWSIVFVAGGLLIPIISFIATGSTLIMILGFLLASFLISLVMYLAVKIIFTIYSFYYALPTAAIGNNISIKNASIVMRPYVLSFIGVMALTWIPVLVIFEILLNKIRISYTEQGAEVIATNMLFLSSLSGISSTILAIFSIAAITETYKHINRTTNAKEFLEKLAAANKEVKKLENTPITVPKIQK